jgi:hypothetical protein
MARLPALCARRARGVELDIEAIRHDSQFKLFTQVTCESLQVWIGEEILNICTTGILDALTCYECKKFFEVFLISQSNIIITHYTGDARYA